MTNSKSIGKSLAKIIVTVSIIFMIYGIFKVNLTLPEVTKQNSSFCVTYSKSPLNLSVKIGEFNIIFSGESFGSFINGTIAIGNYIQDIIKP